MSSSSWYVFIARTWAADKMAELVCGAYVVKKKNTKSAVWQHFGLRATEEGVIVDKEQDKPVCRTCGTSVPSERVFSTAGHVCNDSRSRLLPENVNKLIFLAKNMK